MSLKKDFSENMFWALPGDDILSQENFSEYINQFGAERAQGYLDALNDIVRQMNSYFGTQIGNGFLPNSANIIRRETRKLREEKISLIENGVRLLKDTSTKPGQELNL